MGRPGEGVLGEFLRRYFDAENVGQDGLCLPCILPLVGFRGRKRGFSGKVVETFPIRMCLLFVNLVIGASGPLMVRQKRLGDLFPSQGR